MASRTSASRMSRGRQLDDLVRDPEVAGHPARVRDVLAVGRPDGEGHAVRVHLADVQQRQRAVEAAGQDDADGEVGVDPDADAVLQRGPHLPRGLVDVADRLVAVADAAAGRRTAVTAGSGAGLPQPWWPGGISWTRPPAGTSDLTSEATYRSAVAPRPVERLDPERVTRQVDLVRCPVDDGEGELAAQAVHRSVSPFEERLEHHLGVAVAAQLVAERRRAPTAARGSCRPRRCSRPTSGRRRSSTAARPVRGRRSSAAACRAGDGLRAASPALRRAPRSRSSIACEDQRIGVRPDDEGDTAHVEDPFCGRYCLRS